MTQIVFSHEISSAMLALLRCNHPRDKVADDTCVACGSVALRGSGWARPVLLVALEAAVDVGQKVETSK